jgi:ATP-dependent helicase HrpB
MGTSTSSSSGGRAPRPFREPAVSQPQPPPAAPPGRGPRAPLPIDELLPAIVAGLRAGRSLVVEAPPGAGKTTRVPLALLEAGLAEQGEILVLQPRRLPARLIASHIAGELGEAPGQTVGYTVRFEDVSGPRTRLRFITEGLLTRRLLSDPSLVGVSAVVLDEFHERHLASDLGLALSAQLQTRRPELRLVVMSATLESDPVRAFLGGCPGLRSSGRTYPIEYEHQPATDDRPLPEQVAGAVRRYLRDDPGGGDVLVFLPGAAEIRRCGDALAPLAGSHDLLILPLHGELSPAEQARAVQPASRRKVILSTNVAETSVTIDGVTAVVDSGLARLAAHSSWTGLPTLGVGKISQAAAEQRAGRAGRTRPGRAIRLYTRHDLEARRPYDLPEIARLDLAESLLALHALGVRSPAAFAWFEPPPAAALSAAEELLRRLEAVDAAGALTETGRSMLRFPLHPRLARLLVEAERRGVGEQAAALTALINERDIEERARVVLRGSGPGDENEDMDLLARLDRFQQARAQRLGSDALRALGLNRRAVEAVERSRRQLAGQVRSQGSRPASLEEADRALAQATLAAFPDRVARRRVEGAREAVLAAGGSARVGLSPPGSLLVAVDAEERSGTGGRVRTVSVKLAVEIEPDWLLETAAGGLREEDRLYFSPETERVEATSQLAYGDIVLHETRRPAPPSAAAGLLLAAAAQARGWGPLLGPDALSDLLSRLDLCRQTFSGPEFEAPDQAAVENALVAACAERTSFAELRAAGFEALLGERIAPAFWQRLRRETPPRVKLPGGREVQIHYERDRPPWIESRLQDFFGMQAGPAVCSGRVSLVLHLLAPNGRAVQVTRDLAGFWRQHYPAIRRELSRRYPRHPWPEDGATAIPPAPRKR